MREVHKLMKAQLDKSQELYKKLEIACLDLSEKLMENTIDVDRFIYAIHHLEDIRSYYFKQLEYSWNDWKRISDIFICFDCFKTNPPCNKCGVNIKTL